jgi:hypothetical protein
MGGKRSMYGGEGIGKEVAGDWRTQRYEDLHGLYCSSNIGQVIKSRRKRWAGNVARMGRRDSFI